MRAQKMMVLMLLSACTRTPSVDVDDEVRPVFSNLGPTNALAQRLCVALHTLPSERVAACCKRGGTNFESECTRTLSASLNAGAVELTVERVEACEVAMKSALAGCEWTGPNPLPRPAACVGIVRGKTGAAGRCRSSLECSVGLFCRAAGPTDLGTCQRSSANGASCGLSVDTLAAYSREALEGRHDECQGVCERHRCGPPKATCTSSAHCTGGQHCAADGKCVAGATAAKNEPCVPGACGGTLRCLGGRCAAPLEVGQRCAADWECRGACEQGICAARCS